MTTDWKVLTRGDLAKFDDTATEVILTAMERGGIGRISNRGHATIRHPDGIRTMSVTRDSSIRKAHNMRGDLRKLFPEPPATQANGNSKDATMMQNDLRLPAFTDVQLPEATNNLAPDDDDALIPCPAKKCDAVFVTDGAKYAHIRDEHATCEWPGCDSGPNGEPFVGTTKQSVAGHVQVTHRGSKPWLLRDPAKRKDVARKATETKRRKREALAAAEAAENAAEVESATVPAPPAKPELAPTEPKKMTAAPEHRGLPSKAVEHKPMSDAAKLRAIRELLGEDPRIAKLEARLAELQAHLDLVREAVGLDQPKKK